MFLGTDDADKHGLNFKTQRRGVFYLKFKVQGLKFNSKLLMSGKHP